LAMSFKVPKMFIFGEMLGFPCFTNLVKVMFLCVFLLSACWVTSDRHRPK
jgi:hypothetical protein